MQEAALLRAKNVDMQREGGMRNGGTRMIVKFLAAALPDIRLYTCIFIFQCFVAPYLFFPDYDESIKSSFIYISVFCNQ